MTSALPPHIENPPPPVATIPPSIETPPPPIKTPPPPVETPPSPNATPPPPNPPPPPTRGRWSRVIWIASWVMFGLIATNAVLLFWASDANWFMTLLTFGPRWVVLVPLAPLALGALVCRPRALVPLLLSAGCGIGPVMGFCVPWRSLMTTEPGGSCLLRVVTYNFGGGTDPEELVEFLQTTDPDVVAFQEWSASAPLPKELGTGWFTANKGELLVASRYPIRSLAASPIAEGRYNSPAIRCEIETPGGTVQIHCVHLYTLRKGLNAVIWERWKGAGQLERVANIRNLESELVHDFAGEATGPSIVMGDFNLTADSTVFRRDWGNWQNAFSIRGLGLGYTFNTDKIGLRIDHILADQTRWYVRSCEVGPDLWGQHLPLIAELVLLPPTETQETGNQPINAKKTANR